MSELVFSRADALEAIRTAKAKGLEWLYSTYRKPGGKMRRSSTGFIEYEDTDYPVKPLGRLANAIAGSPMEGNPYTGDFLKYFEALGFSLAEVPDDLSEVPDETEKAHKRKKRSVEVWSREQAKFRVGVFKLYGPRCIISGCRTLAALEAAHILPVYAGGDDSPSNGIPLRADLHRLFDCGQITLQPGAWKVSVVKPARNSYGEYHGLDVADRIKFLGLGAKLSAALRKRLASVAGED